VNGAKPTAADAQREAPRERGSLRAFVLYFLKLGSLGFGGPIVLAGHMQRDLVEERGWITQQDYVEGLALAQLAPGPLAAQLAIYLGWVRAGVAGATLVAAAFILPSFLIVLAISAFYIRYGGLAWVQGAFYGIGAAVIAIIARSVWKLMRATLKSDALLWTLFGLTAVVTAWTATEIVWLFVLCGVIALVVKAPPRFLSRTNPGAAALATPIFSGWWFTGAHGVASLGTLGKIALYFAEAGAFIFGSGLAIVPFLYGGVVHDFHWLTERQFLDAVAVAMITPGPVVITVAFIGYLVAGPAGAVTAALGVFLPCYLLVILPAKYYRRAVQNSSIKAFVAGVTAAATGAIAGAGVVLGRRSIVDATTILVALVTFAGLLGLRKIPEPLWICAAGVAGVLLFHAR
jgi:chromate transporter